MDARELCIVAVLKAKEGQGELMHSAIVDILIKPTRLEEGCLLYVLHHDNKDKDSFVFYEKWVSAEHLQKHLESPHMKQFQDKVKDILVSSVIYELAECDC